MRKMIVLLAAMLIAGQASAKTHDWHGTIAIDLGALETMYLEGSGVATVNDSSASNHLSTLILHHGITDSGVIPVTDPNTTGQIKSIRITGTLGGAVAKQSDPWTITGISGVPPLGRNKLAMGGFTRVCIFTAGCTTNLPVVNTVNSGNTGVCCSAPASWASAYSAAAG